MSFKNLAFFIFQGHIEPLELSESGEGEIRWQKMKEIRIWGRAKRALERTIYGEKRIQAEIGATEGEDKRKMEENMKSDDGGKGQEEGNMQQKTLAYLQNTYTYLLTLILTQSHVVTFQTHLCISVSESSLGK